MRYRIVYCLFMIIAVDFDGTIVEHRYPEIGKELPFAIDTLRRLSAEGHGLILWTVREGKLLEDAVDFCRKRGLEFLSINENPGSESECVHRKVVADIYIDDRNVGGLPDWGIIYEMISQGLSHETYVNTTHAQFKRQSWRDRLPWRKTRG